MTSCWFSEVIINYKDLLFHSFFIFKLYFIDYATTVVPIFPLCLPTHSTPNSLLQSPHHCPWPWVMHINSLSTPFPILFFTSPWLFQNCLSVFLNPLTSSPADGKATVNSCKLVGWILRDLHGQTHSVSPIDGVSDVAPACRLCGSARLSVWERAVPQLLPWCQTLSPSLYATGAFQAATRVLELRGSESE